MRWQLKFVKNAVFAVTPGTARLRELKRRVKPYPAEIDAWTLEQGLRMLEMLREAGIDIRGRTALELGTGWQPVIPLLFSLAGAREVFMFDSQALLDSSLVSRVVHNFRFYVPQIARRLSLCEDDLHDKLHAAEAQEGPAMLKALNLNYQAPADGRSTELAPASLDVVFSRAVLEHVPPRVIVSLLDEFHRVLSPSGAMCHIIDNGDHWAMDDPSISRVNFLKFSDAAWGWLGINPLDYQNRLRHSDYLALLEGSGFAVTLDKSAPDSEALQALGNLKLASRFQGKSRDDLAILTSYLVARPARKGL